MNRASMAFVAFLSIQSASAATLTFQDGVGGYTGARDTIVRSNQTASGSGQATNGDSRNLSFGTLDFLSIDGDDGSPGARPNHGLIGFDGLFGNGPGQIRATDTITSATLTLQVFDEGSGFTVHDMLASWSEASTWNSLGDGIQANGVEASTGALASFGANNSGANVSPGTIQVNVLSSLLSAQAGNPFHGWALLPFTAGTNGVDIRSGEFATPELRPLLTVNVTPVPVPAALPLLASAVALLGAARLRRA